MNPHTLEILEYNKVKELLKEQTVSSPGADLCEKLYPEPDIYLVKHRLLETTQAKALLDKGAAVPLSALNGMDRIMEKLGKVPTLQPDELDLLRNMLRASARLKHYMQEREMTAPLVASYALSLSELADLTGEIARCILDGRVDDKASPELSRVRKRMAIVEERIASKLESILRSPAYKGMLQDTLVSMRQGNYVIPVKREHRKSVEGAVMDLSSSGSTVFIEPSAIKALKGDLDVLRLEEQQEVFRILSVLTELAAGYKKEITINFQTLSHYDFLFAKAKLSRTMDGVSPEMRDDGILHLISARHPLLGSKAVPLDFRLGGDYKALVITGPNTGGKTVVLKTVGLLALMAQSGLHIPAVEGSSLCLFTEVLADIGDGQSLEQSLSTFSSHIGTIIGILNRANPGSLVLLDELGTGTDPREGMGLAVAIMEALYAKGCLMVCTTHFSEIKAFAEDTPGFKNGSMLFDTHTLKPLYRLSIGMAGESNAFLIALRLGMPPSLLERAHHISYKEKHTYLPLLSQEKGSVVPANAPEPSEKDTTGTSLKAGTGQRESQLSFSRSTMGDEDSESRLEAAKRREDLRKKQELQKRPPSFKVGDCVFLSAMNRTGIVCEAENARGEVGVIVMKKRLTVPAKRLRPFIDGKDLYPDDYDMAIVLDSKDNRKKRKLMGKRHVEGLQIEHPPS